MLRIKLGHQHFKRGNDGRPRTEAFKISHAGEELKIYVERVERDAIALVFDGDSFKVWRPDPIARSNAPAL